MKSTQAWGWLAAGVLAAGLNAAYHDGGFAWAHRIADQAQHVSSAVVALASGHADQFLAEAQMLTASNDEFSDAADAKADQQVAWAEAAYARAEAFQAREQAHCARIRAEHARIEQRIAARQSFMRAPEAEIETTFRTIEIPGIPATRIEIPQVKIHCSYVRMNLPAMPRIDVPAVPAISVSVSGGSAE
jgi:hypothetical protein